jgi:hypothetical protein
MAAVGGGIKTVAELGVLVGDVIGHAEKTKGWLADKFAKRRRDLATSGDANAATKVLLTSAGLREDDDAHTGMRQHVLLILAAFGEAWARCRHYEPDAWPTDLKSIQQQFSSILAQPWPATIAPDGPDAKARLEFLGRLATDPIHSPFYQALWQTLINNVWDKPLLPQKQYRFFESCFRLAYGAFLSAPEGEEARRYLDQLNKQRTNTAFDMLLQDMAGWGARHVFGNVLEDSQLPDLPLQTLYVEPLAVVEGQDSKPRPVLGLLSDLLKKHKVIVVRADMGQGKSLTARHMAWDLARDFLSSRESGPRTTCPIFVKCAQDLAAELVDDLQTVCRRARWRHSEDLRLGLAEDDPACAPPSRDQQTLYILDGLDEVVLSADGLRRLFDHLRRTTSEMQRVVVFTRPQILPREQLKEGGVPVVALRLLTTGQNSQAAQWMERWNYLVRAVPPITWEAVESRKLGDLAATPILLFMIAYTWQEFAIAPIDRVALYEKFLSQLARGKLEADSKESNPRISEASQRLLEHLQEHDILQRSDDKVASMLWLMSRVAWKAHCQEQINEDLRLSDVEELLKHQLKLRDRGAQRPIALGLLLALQADPEGDDPALLFGHKSFREFLVGRYWAWVLRKTMKARDKDRPELEQPLLEGRLLAATDNSFSFLIESINSNWSPEEHMELRNWAEECFNSEESGFLPDATMKTFRHDRRPYLRESALAIGSHATKTGMIVRDVLVLRSLMSWFWLHGRTLQCIAPNMVHKRGHLGGVLLIMPNFRKADLEDAHLGAATLLGANLAEANLAGANLVGATLVGSDLSGANLNKANLVGATLLNANLAGANLRGAKLTHANLAGTNLRNADLTDAELGNAAFFEKQSRGMALGGIPVGVMSLISPWFEELLVHQSFSLGFHAASARFEAKSPGSGSNCAIYNHRTRWPTGFNPKAVGAARDDKNEDPSGS